MCRRQFLSNVQMAGRAWDQREAKPPNGMYPYLQFQGARVDRNSAPWISSSAAADGCAPPPAGPAPLISKKPLAACPPGLVAPLAYLSCSVTHVLCDYTTVSSLRKLGGNTLLRLVFDTSVKGCKNIGDTVYRNCRISSLAVDPHTGGLT